MSERGEESKRFIKQEPHPLLEVHRDREGWPLRCEWQGRNIQQGQRERHQDRIKK